MYDLVAIIVGAALGWFLGGKLSKCACSKTNAIVGGVSGWLVPWVLAKLGVSLAFGIGGYIGVAVAGAIGGAIGLFVFGLVKGKKA